MPEHMMIEGFRWSIALTARVLVRTIMDGSTAVMQAIHFDDSKRLRRALLDAPRDQRCIWQLAVQVGSQSISPLFWALRTGEVKRDHRDITYKHILYIIIQYYTYTMYRYELPYRYTIDFNTNLKFMVFMSWQIRPNSSRRASPTRSGAHTTAKAMIEDLLTIRADSGWAQTTDKMHRNASDKSKIV